MATARTPRTVRRLGWVLLVVGLLLVGMMGTIAWRMYPSMSHPGVADAGGTTFTGTAAQAHAALQLFGGVVAFGVASILTGIWQIVTGRRNWLLVGIAAVIAAAIVVTARGFIAA